MNSVDFLIENKFSMLNDADKKKIVELGPDHPNVNIVQCHKSQQRRFNETWYEKKGWLTASTSKSSLFCFYCLLFGGDDAWTRNGVRDMKHLSERIRSHEASSSHIRNAMSFNLFGKIDIRAQINAGYAYSIKCHNELVDKNRHVLGRIIDCIKFCGVHEIPLRGKDESTDSLNRGVFLDLLEQFSNSDPVLHSHINDANVGKYTSASMQNELLECILQVYKNELQGKVKEASYISLQADETTDVSIKSQLVLVLRYVDGVEIKESFHGFLNITDRSASGIANVILEELNKYELGSEKFVSQSYDGAPVMSGHVGGVQKLVKDVYPNAYFNHCYAHQLNIIMKKVCSSIIPVRIFFANLSAFSSFFSMSSKRTDLLQCICQKKLPKPSATRWNFQSRCVTSVHENKASLNECFSHILEEGSWNDVSVREASGLKRLLSDSTFIFFLDFFSEIMPLTDMFYNLVQTKITNQTDVNVHLEHFVSSIKKICTRLRNESVLSSSVTDASVLRKRGQVDLHSSAVECCEKMIAEAEARFRDKNHLLCFSLVNPVSFAAFEKNFPELPFSAVTAYPFINREQLKGELRVLYASDEFRGIQKVTDLYAFCAENNLISVFPESVKLMNIILTTPVVSAEAERCFSTLKRVKTCSRNAMGSERLNALCALAIEKKFISSIVNFNKKVIDIFASDKGRRLELFYK